MVEGARVLDLFAGSGAYGLEAWSRGAVCVTFFERHAGTVKHLRRNADSVAKSLGEASSAVRVCQADLYKLLPEGEFDLIIADPPYPDLTRAVPRIREIALACLTDSDSARLCLEGPAKASLNLSGFELLKEIGKGREQPCVRVYRRSEAG
jgi:16S rRNA (guanine966-N2)-methyltransferase